MDDILALPTGPLVDASLALARATESPPIVDHSIRTFLFARLLANHEGCLNDAAYDEDLLFAATVMHDLGLGEHARGHARFEVEGADLAAAVLREHGVADADVDRVWEAIALHSSHGLAERRGLLTYLTYKGVFIDAGRLAGAVAAGLRDEVLNAYPKPADGPYILDAIIAHANRSPTAAPPGSLAAHLLLRHVTEGRRMTITLDSAQGMIERARAHAAGINVPMNIAVTDGGGHLLAFARMDGAILGSIDIALTKAKTSILFNGPSENPWEFCKPGGPAPATELTNGGLIPYAGGVALHDDGGALIGAIGVSGGLPDQDGEVARAAIGKDEQ